MKFRIRVWTGIGAVVCLFILIIDSKTALSGAKDGLELCLRTVIPSLFPFFVLSYLINKSFIGKKVSFLLPINRLCGIPQGAESIFLLGFLGGYPVGAQSIDNAYSSGHLNQEDARRMLGFCSNAGPSFIFGMANVLFTSNKSLWALWLVHVLSAFTVACILPRKRNSRCLLRSNGPVSVATAVEQSAKTMCFVCAWVIVFRVIIAFLQSWFLWILPEGVQVVMIGLLELTNGCVFMNAFPLEGQRFVLCAVLLGIGGLCVAMQTVSVTKTIGIGMYFPGKILQGIFSFFFAAVMQHVILPGSEIFIIPVSIYILLVLFTITLVIILFRSKKVVAIPC